MSFPIFTPFPLVSLNNASIFLMITKMSSAYMTVSSTIVASMTAMAVVLGMFGMSNSLHNSIETTVRTSNVVNDSNGTIGFLEGVRALYLMTISVFILFLFVASVRIMHSVVKVVMSRTLVIKKIDCSAYESKVL